MKRPYATQTKDERIQLEHWVQGRLRKKGGAKVDVATGKPYTAEDLAKMASRRFKRQVTDGQIRAAEERLRNARVFPRIPPPSPALDPKLLCAIPAEPEFERTPWDVLLDRVEALEAHGHIQARLIRHLYTRLGVPVPE